MTRTLMIGLSLLALVACETIEGAGQDLSKAGNAISQESREVQSGM
ncbi:entericidin A/B family lipoprotein [Celeribacter baekdonensis]|uniref:Entericidin, EcnA/B family n=1 Tax=Celeribacter baekdonensis TaxID=875171 RepID=A0A2R4M3T4_9RHOB|nr:entericidin A/B family lipoprotein [Celeribacter baekdonensis]AVW91874.1 entericidin, EcnA/B family [Celeribacter baekdonensis]